MTIEFVNLITAGIGQIRNAAAGVFNGIISGFVEMILSFAGLMFSIAFSVVFEDGAFQQYCVDGQAATDCATGRNLAWFTDVYGRSVVVASMLLLALTAFAVGRAAIFGGPGRVLAVGLGRMPQSILMMLFVVPATILLLEVVDSAALVIAPDLDGNIDVLREAMVQNGTGTDFQIGGHALMLMIFGMAAAIGSMLVWLWMLMRSIAIYVLVIVFAFIAVTNVTGARSALQRWAKMLLVLIFSKLVVVAVLSLGLSAVINVGPIGQAFGQEVVVVPPPPGEEGEPLTELQIEQLEVSTEIGQTIYQMMTATLLTWLAAFSPFLVMRILPDTWESSGRLEYGTQGMRQQMKNRTQRGAVRAGRGVRAGIRGVR